MAAAIEPNTKRKKQTATGASPISNAQAILNNLKKVFGFTDAQAAGFLGNFEVESSFNPDAYNARENAHGFAQWENGRWTALQSYASAHHLSPTSTAADLGYLDSELKGPYANVVSEVKGTNNVTQAAQIVQSQYEGSDPSSLGTRESDASSIFAQISSGHALTQGGIAGSTVTGVAAGASGSSGFLGGVGGDIESGIGGIFTGAGKDIATGITEVIKEFLAPFEQWVVDAFAIVAGVVVLIIAVVLIAKSAAHDDDGGQAAEPEPAERPAEPEHAAEAAATA